MQGMERNLNNRVPVTVYELLRGVNVRQTILATQCCEERRASEEIQHGHLVYDRISYWI
jgi:hypothetical protein